MLGGKDMKKFFAATLALMLMMGATTTAFAEEIKDNGGKQDIPVKAKYDSGVSETPVVSVDVKWDAMEFTYSVGGSRTWNAEDHTYTDNTSSTWTAVNNTVTVTNHSNVGVKVKTAYTSMDAYKGVTGTFTYDKTAGTDGYIALTRGIAGEKESADSVTATLTLSGTLSKDVTTSTKVGTITVLISTK